MKLGKHTLLIDGNYFLHSRLFVLPRPKGKQLLGDKDSQSQLMRKLCIDFASEVRKMSPFVDQIVIAVDARSWRKDLFPEAEYKGTRVPDNSVNWKAVFEVYAEWQKILAKKGVIVHQVSGAEADDVMYGWATQLNSEGKNCIAWTGDRDLIQLVNYNNATDAYTLWYYSSKKRLITFEGFEEVMAARKTSNMTNAELMFNLSSEESTYDKLKDDFQHWMDKNRVTVEEINCDDFVFGKILQGDKSDNIQSVVTWTKAGANGKIRNYSLTEKHTIKILEQYKREEGEFQIDHFFNRGQVNKLIEIIYRVLGKSNINDIRIRFNQNLDLILLHYNTVPLAIQSDIYKHVELDRNVVPELSGITQMEKILEGTEWNVKKSTGAPRHFNAFSNLKEDKIDISKDSKKLNELF
jgi:5'-3' exonuclease|tara:strand:+ start:3184 stop:4410 length:1227 start_codon:yes stop_codon:yes gene_type:complete